MHKFLSFAAIAAIVAAISVSAVMAQDAEATAEPDTETPTETVTVRAWIGARVANTDSGVTIVRIHPESPAALAELQEGDLITAFNGTEVSTAAELVELVSATAPEDTVTLDIVRDDEALTVELTLGSAPERSGRGAFGDGGHGGMRGERGGRGGMRGDRFGLPGQVDPNAPLTPDVPAEPDASTIDPAADGGQV